MSLDQAEDIVVIRTLECDICERFDSILLRQDEINERVNRNSLLIGSHIINHGNHLRIVYFDISGEYLGDTISLKISDPPLQKYDINPPLFQDNYSNKWIKLKNKMLGIIISHKQRISIIGPSFAGKTSLTMYLESGIPERYSKRVNHSPTMGKSLKRFSFGSTKLSVFDMGGQRNFWEQWTEPIKNSDRIIFVLDGTANNKKEIIDALVFVSKIIPATSSLLIILNKIDLVIEGYANNFIEPKSIIQNIDFPDDLSFWFVKASVYNGRVYGYSSDNEETILAEVISDFLIRE